MKQIATYRDLLVWQRSMGLAETIYKLTQTLPPTEQWGLVSQMRRAAVSVPCNIAEGYGRQASGEYRHHLSISRGSLLELDTQVLLCERLACLTPADTQAALREIEEISKMLRSLISKIR